MVFFLFVVLAFLRIHLQHLSAASPCVFNCSGKSDK
uniref:Uncharacterized protein n=1 Tax=Anopheles quadriannulatus TaxID=34691 RepID=A0A182XQE0_ANOQN